MIALRAGPLKALFHSNAAHSLGVRFHIDQAYVQSRNWLWSLGAHVFILSVYGALFTGHGEYGISAHLWLTFTGTPLSFISWGFPHGSVLGVAVAGTAGTIQWCAISEFSAWWDRRILKKTNGT